MKRLLLILLAAPLWASDSLSLAGGTQLFSAATDNTAWASVTDYRIEITATDYTPPGGNHLLAGLTSFAGGVVTTATGPVGFRPLNGATDCILGNLNGATNFRIRGQRITASTLYALEIWNEDTGAYTLTTCTDTDPSAVNLSAATIYAGRETGTQQTLKFGALRMFSTTVPTGSDPPQRLLTSGYGELGDWEWESALTDASGLSQTMSASSGSPTYVATPVYDPAVVISGFTRTLQVGQPAISIDLSNAAFTNQDDPSYTCLTTQSGVMGTLTNGTSCSTTTFATLSFGTTYLDIAVSDVSMNTTNQEFPVGGTIPNADGSIDFASECSYAGMTECATIAAILGPTILCTENPWEWQCNRTFKFGDTWVEAINTFFPLLAQVAGAGTVETTYASDTLVFSSVNAQDTFCGGGTSPVAATSMIAVWYASPIYMGELGRAYYQVDACPTSSTVTIFRGWGHTTGTVPGLSYSVINPARNQPYGNYTFSRTLGDYYDMVQGFYSLYYSTGLETYRDAARDFANRWFRSPIWDLGMSMNFGVLGGTWNYGGPGRGKAVNGLLLWTLEDPSAMDVTAGVHYLWDYWISGLNSQIAQDSAGNNREIAYEIGGVALCAHFDPDMTYRTNCRAVIEDQVDFLDMIKTASGYWVWGESNRAVVYDGSGSFGCAATCYVSAQDGDATLTLVGGTWTSGAFDDCYGSGTPKDCWIWLTFDTSTILLPGNSTSAIGDTVAYKVSSVTDGQHLELTVPYNSGMCASPCQRAMQVGTYAGLGALPYMTSMLAGVLGTYTYDYLISIGDTARAATVSSMVQTSMAWVATAGQGYDATNHAFYGASQYIQCDANGAANAPCAGDTSLNAEGMRGVSASYTLNQDVDVRAFGEDIYHYVWGKPGYAAPYPTSGSTYLTALNDDGYMLILADSEANKWFGFFWGWGFGGAWPVARQIGETQTFAPVIVGRPTFVGLTTFR